MDVNGRHLLTSSTQAQTAQCLSSLDETEGIPAEGFAAYIKQRNYDLHSPKAHGKMLEDAGFIQVDAIDATESLFLPCLLGEVKAMELGKGAFLNEFTAHDYLAMVNGWSDKIARGQSGEQRWGVFYAKKADPCHKTIALTTAFGIYHAHEHFPKTVRQLRQSIRKDRWKVLRDMYSHISD